MLNLDQTPHLGNVVGYGVFAARESRQRANHLKRTGSA